MPVGEPGPAPLVGGTTTGEGGVICAPRPLYNTEKPVWFAEIQNVLVAPAISPHAFCRLPSVLGALPLWSATKLVTW